MFREPFPNRDFPDPFGGPSSRIGAPSRGRTPLGLDTFSVRIPRLAQLMPQHPRRARPASNLDSLRQNIKHVAEEEFKKWRYSRNGRIGAYDETDTQIRDYLEAYWEDGAGIPVNPRNFRSTSWQDNHYWSAAFISWVAKEAGAGNRFAYSRRHATYIHAALWNRELGRDNPFRCYRLDEATPAIGDLVVYWRKRARSYDSIKREFPANAPRVRFSSHTDFVVQVDTGQLFTVGGNVAGNTVGAKTVALDANGFIRPIEDRIALIKIEDPPLSARGGVSV